MKITHNILEAVAMASKFYGNDSQLAARLGVAHSTIFFWQTGKTKNISGKLWESKIKPVLDPFLKKVAVTDVGSHTVNYRPVAEHQPPVVYALHEPSVFGPEDYPSTVAESPFDPVPVVSLDSLLSFDPATETIVEFRSRCKISETYFGRPKLRDYFAVLLENGLPGNFAKGTMMLVSAGESAEDGDLIMVRVRDEKEIQFCRFSRNENEFVLKSIVPDGKEYRWDRMQNIGYLLWAYPVLEAKTDFRVVKNFEKKS